MMRSSGYNRCGVLMGTSWRASGPRSHRLQGDFSPMITLILLQRAFCATAKQVVRRPWNKGVFGYHMPLRDGGYFAIHKWMKNTMAKHLSVRILSVLGYP